MVFVMAPFRLFLLAVGLGAALVALLWGAVAGATPTIHVAGQAVAKRAQTGGLTPGGVPFPADCRIPKSLLTGRSRAVGRPGKGRLVNGLPLPEESDYWFTWNFPGGFSPNPEFRRYGTEKLILTLECVLTQYGMRHPELARIGVADIALTHGGPFYGKKYGGLGHGSHQNGLDADVLMPRQDLCECASQSPSEVDAARAQELVDAFAAAGAQYEFVSPVLYRRGLLHGKRGQVIPLQFHDDHIHVRIRP
jgi:murein endopeptidase